MIKKMETAKYMIEEIDQDIPWYKWDVAKKNNKLHQDCERFLRRRLERKKCFHSSFQ